MIVKSGEQYRFSNRMKEIDGIARSKVKELKILESNAFINALYDEIKMMDEQITDMANTIDRLEAALYNVLNERDQLMKDLKESVFSNLSCIACKHQLGCDADCMFCTPLEGNVRWEWRGVPEVKDDDA